MALRKVKRPVLIGGSTEQKKAELMMNQINELDINHSDTSQTMLDDFTLLPYRIEGNSLLYWDKEKQKFTKVCNAAKIVRVNRNIESKEITLELCYWAYDRWEHLKVNRGELVKRELRKLASKGLDVLDDTALSHISTFLNKHEKTLMPVNTHSTIGWEVNDKGVVYKHSKLISNSYNTFQSVYDGKYQLQPKGSLEDYISLINREVIGHVPLEIMLCIGVTPLIVGMLNRSGIAEVDSLLVHLPGKSTTGKTTAAMLAASVAGNPGINENGLLQTFNGTKNAMSQLLVNNYGVPIVFDESSMNQMDSESLSSFLYEIAQNQGRLRLNRNSELKDQGTWSTTIISTGEHSVIDKANQNEGLRVRLMEFSNTKWTKGAENADRLKIGLLHNYGHIAPIIAEKMIHLGPKQIANMVDDNKADILSLIPKSRFAARVAGKLANILTAAELIEETLGIRLSGDRLISWLVEQEEISMTEREMAPKFYQQLREYLVRYSKNFKVNNQLSQNYNEIWGKIEVHEGRTYCYILPTIFKRIASELNYTDSKLLLEELKILGVLQHEKNKNQKRKVIFSKDEVNQRKESIGKEGFAEKGDYTVCLVYEGNLLQDL